MTRSPPSTRPCAPRPARRPTRAASRPGDYAYTPSVFSPVVGRDRPAAGRRAGDAAAPIAYLESLQHPDGSWPSLIPGDTGDSDVDSTAMAAMALALVRTAARPQTAVAKALRWIAARQAASRRVPRRGRRTRSTRPPSAIQGLQPGRRGVRDADRGGADVPRRRSRTPTAASTSRAGVRRVGPAGTDAGGQRRGRDVVRHAAARHRRQPVPTDSRRRRSPTRDRPPRRPPRRRAPTVAPTSAAAPDPGVAAGRAGAPPAAGGQPGSP